MGLIDFIKDAGAKILGREGGDEAAIKNYITQAFGGKIKNLEIGYTEGTVRLTGIAESQAQKEKAILIAGNVHGVERVDGDGLTIEAAPSATASVQPSDAAPAVGKYYTIEKGDTLSGIAKKVYKDASKFDEIFEANREVIKNPDLIYPGQKIRIPEVSAH